jgi:cytochrome c553
MLRAAHLLSLRFAAPLALAVLAAACSRDDGSRIASADEATAALKKYCADCHNDAEFSGEMSVARLNAAAVQEDPEIWEHIVRKLRTRTMPPQDAPRPDAATYESLARWLESALDAAAPQNPGAPALRRLNRAEYANAIRDLLDLEVDVNSLLPPDDSAFGFDNIGDMLVFSPTLLERYLSAADRISALAIGDPTTVAGAKTYMVKGDESQTTQVEGLPLGTVGGMGVTHVFPLDGEYEFNIGLLRNNLDVIRGLEHPHQIEISVDGRQVFLTGIGGEYEANRQGTTINELSDSTESRLRVRVPVEAGPRTVTASFIRKIGEGANRLRPFERSSAGTYDGTGRPHVETLTITGPFAALGPGDTPSRRRIFSCTPSTAGDDAGRDARGRATQGAVAEARCAREILSTLARRAYRRPVDSGDVDRLMGFFEEGRANGGFETGMQLALRRILASPSFAFRVEQEPESPASAVSFAVSDVELATRLSFFLWSSIPDDELLALAEQNQLSDPATLRAQVRRMLADPKASALVENFAGQWLHLRNLDNINPNSDEFPDFDNNLRQGFKRETELFFASIVNEDRSLLDLMTADYTFVDERLAKHYGIPQIYGSHFRRVQLGPELAARRGLLGKGGILMATSHADRTAPTLRGKWLLENILGSPPPPPPANVPGLETAAGEAPTTIRERLESHRANPACASCHQIMDPLGFAMENFDAVGGWRTLEAGRPVDASGAFTDGRAINGAAELREALLADPGVFADTVTRKLMTYALGRGLQYYDMPVVRRVLERARDDNYKFSDIVLGIVDSAPFKMRAKAPVPQDAA